VYLAYTPVWGAACGVMMLGGFVEKWGDGPLCALGFGLWFVLLAAGFAFRAPEDRGRPFHQLYHVKLSAFMAVFAFLANYFGTRYFYEVLDMHYGFRTTWNLNDVPLFLYPLIAVYFTTYAVLLDVALAAAAAVGIGRASALVLTSLALAAVETSLHSNPWMRASFCYGSLRVALVLGTAMYGLSFVIAGPLWHRIDERPGECTPLSHVLASVFAAFMMILCADEVFANVIAPRFTVVVPGRVGIPGKQGPSCLEARRD
jgi:cycloeucalenol cycloisomerase